MGLRWVLAGTALALGSCAGPSAKRIADMDIAVTHQHPVCVTLAVRGSDERSLGEVKDVAKIYEKALRDAILRNHVFSGFCAQGQAGLELTVTVSNGGINFGKGGWHLEGTVPARWRLADPVARRVLYQESPLGTGVGDHGVGGNARINAGYEAAMRASIRQGLQDISRLDLSAGK